MIIKLLIAGILAFLAFKLFRKPVEVESKKEVSAVETVQDPINGVYVGKDTEFKVKYYDKIYYFSSKESMEEFIQQKKGEENEDIS
jgi:YHS domain-containing protein